MAASSPPSSSPNEPPHSPKESERISSGGVDPQTGEPRGGFLGLYQRVEDLVGQGAVACILVVVVFLIYAAYKIASL